MRFSCKALLSDYTKQDGTRAVAIRAIIDRKPATIQLGFYIHPKHFDQKRQRIKGCENADVLNLEINIAIGKASKIASDFRRDERYLSARDFLIEFKSSANRQDFTQFFTAELELRKPKIELITYRQHKTVLNKLTKFKERILFAELSVELIQRFENFLIGKPYNNKGNTVKKTMSIINSYLHQAERKELKFKNPFDNYKLKASDPLKPTLSIKEVQSMFEYYYNPDCNATHRKILRYFLFSCTTGLRVSDVMRIRWNDIHDNTLIFLPHKTRKRDRYISIPLTPIHLSLLPVTKDFSGEIFDCCVEQVTNRYLKKIATICGIKKKLTYHISRHTFATEFLSRGGQLDTLQQLLGHSMITTTMKYVKVKEERKRSELTTAFEGIFPGE
jgi:site-specific recombinase XerD